MFKKIRKFIILIIVSLSLASCTDGEVRKIYKEQNNNIVKLEEKLKEVNLEKEELESNMEYFIRLKEEDKESYLKLEGLAKNILEDESIDSSTFNNLGLLKTFIESMPQNLVFEEAIFRDGVRIDHASSDKNIEDLTIEILSKEDTEDLMSINIRGSIQSEEKARNTLNVMDSLLKEIFLNSEEVEAIIPNYIKALEKNNFKQKVELSNRQIILRSTKESKDKLYGYIEMNIVY